MMLQELWNRGSWLEGNVNLLDSKENYVIEVAVPGFSKEDIKVSVKSGRIVVTAHKDMEEDRGKYLKESFKRSKDIHEVIGIPGGFDTKDISAKVIDGILELTIPKSSGTDIEIL